MKSREFLINEQNKLIELLPEVRWQFRKIPGITNIGIGAKEVGGELTDAFAFRIYVNNKKALSELERDEILPVKIKGIWTDVILNSKHIQLADESKYRPLKGGSQLRNEYVEGSNDNLVGTLGCLAEHISTNDVVALSCQHVLMAGQAQLNVKIGQPRYIVSCCCCTYNEIGNVSNVLKNDQVDCGIVILDDDIESAVKSGNTLNEIQEIGTISGVAQAVCFENVKKRGRTTGLTHGRVTDVLFDGSQILIAPSGTTTTFAQRGDSGSVIVNDSNQVIGLLWAADIATRNSGIANHIGPVMQAMDIRIAGAAGTGLNIPGTHCGPPPP